MYDFIEGDLVSRTPGEVVLQAGGVGYFLHVSLSTYARLGTGGRAKLYTHLHVREDCLRLYGFSTRDEREIFRQLHSVQLVGPDKALKLISAMKLDALRSAVATGNVAALCTVKGIGKKTAERIVVELRDKMMAAPSEWSPLGMQDNVSQALMGLMTLGYSRSESQRAVDKAIELLGAQTPIEELIREALRYA